MSLKGKTSQKIATPSENALEGAWGTIVPPSTPLDALRFSREPEDITSYAYRVIVKWRWKPGPPETIFLIAGPDLVTITGHGLKRLIDALDETRLQTVRQEGPEASGQRPCILSIQIEEGSR
ncbi:hypothetical protein SAMN05444156_0609 [Verrucomicrobium sp. GAS474]|uniref:hypothetical protein n=1 Tax=Verrucomicrobium sp. GAS474 TaxID=1882831 RepID=UPI00087B7B61|nr:hypothetical protein [Verrucomicrobium sp. GAS474]SDT90531.1 hypothetical protein SAMN05444156_0609 [Verrucomicrobium sp. GAS474]